MEYLIEGIILAILLICSAFFSASETAVFHLSKVTTEKLASKFQIIRDRGKLLPGILLWNTLVNTGASIIAARLFYKISHSGNQAVIVGIMTYVILVVGEFSPKLYSLRNAEKVSTKTMPILNLIQYVFLPITVPINALIQIIIPQPLPKALITREEIKVFAEYQADEGNITDTEKEFILNLLDFKSRKVEDIMTPVDKMVALPISTTLDHIITQVNMAKLTHSRIPVYRKDITHIIGILYIKDLLTHDTLYTGKIHPKVFYPLSRTKLRKPHFVQQTMNASDLLYYFRRKRVHIAIVVDKRNNTKGLVTLDDVFNSIIK